MDPNLTIILAALIGAISGLSGTLIAHMISQKKEKRQLLRNKVEELHEFIYNTSILGHAYDTDIKYKSIADILNKIRPDKARLIIELYFPKLQEPFDKFADDIPKFLDLSKVRQDEWKRAVEKFDSSEKEFKKALVKCFNERKLNK